MTILLLIRNHGYLRNYESTIRLLAGRGHRVIVASRGAERHMAVDTEAHLARLCAEYPSVSVIRLGRRKDAWAPLAEAVRSLRNYARYLEPLYRHAHKLRTRAADHARKLGASGLPQAGLEAWRCRWLGALFEHALPPDAAIVAALQRLAPDVIAVTPYVDFNSYQVDYVAAARALGIPSVWCVASWDNLSNKGLAPIVPDRVLVWNEAQRREAETMHGIPPDRVVVTGAQLFDEWFTRTPSTDRAGFCARAGLPDRPFLLYLCSSLFIAPDEVSFVRRWLEQLRASPHPALRSCGVLVRPHPGHAAIWAEADLSAFGPVSVRPRGGELPLEEEAKRDYFDALSHCAAVAGVNTSGMIEAAIAGRRSYTLLADEFADTQRGTVHFEYLTSYGFLTAAATWSEHLDGLSAALEGRAAFDLRDRALTFVRPLGADRAATPMVADQIEAAAGLPSKPSAPPAMAEWRLRLARAGLARWLPPVPAPSPADAAASTRSSAPPRHPARPAGRPKG